MAVGRLLNKVSIITASTDGIGLAIAKRFLDEGSKVVISSRKQENVTRALDSLKSHASKSGAEKNICGDVCHVGKAEDRKKLIDFTLQKYGHIDILINNATANPAFGPMVNVSDSAFDKILDVNVKSGFNFAKEVYPYMQKQNGGAILFISSIAAYTPLFGLGAYSVAKTALLGLTRTLSREFAADNIRVNCLAPGLIQTKFSKDLVENSTVQSEVINHIPMARVGKPEEMAGPAVFLCSEDASYITGETLLASGGLVASRL